MFEVMASIMKSGHISTEYFNHDHHKFKFKFTKFRKIEHKSKLLTVHFDLFSQSQTGSSASLNDALDVKVSHLVLLAVGILLNL